MIRAALLLMLMPAVAQAQALNLPARAVLAAQVQEPEGRYAIAVAPAREGVVVSQPARGSLVRRAYRIDGAGVTTGQLLTPLRDQIEGAGFDVLFSCEAVKCGGFDFRFGLVGFGAPEMFVDLGDFRYLAARKSEEAGVAYVTLLVSRSQDAGYIEVTQVTPSGGATPVIANTATSPVAQVTGALAEELDRIGRAVLTGLEFKTGSSDLAAGSPESLGALVDYLRAFPDRKVALVGHTDSEGALEGNIALSKRRAGSVRARLLEQFDIPAAQVQAEGMGYLSPVASNLTADGREANRRVEVIVISTQ